MSNTIKPIFLLSSSWRSGSTLLQRYLTASGEALIWGETGGALNALNHALNNWEQTTASSCRLFQHGTGGNGEMSYQLFLDSKKADHPHQWIANLTPPYLEILETVRNLIITLYEKRAIDFGYPRFGIKETRCDIADAKFLRVLFPDAKFVFLVRNPISVMLSIKRRSWLGRKRGFATLRYFSKHWLIRSKEFRQANFGMAIRYEDFISDIKSQAKLLEYLEINSSPPNDFIQKSHVDWNAQDTSHLTVWENWWLRRWLGEEMEAWLY